MNFASSSKFVPVVCMAILAGSHCGDSVAQEIVTGWEGSSSRGYAFVSPSAAFATSGQFSWIVRGAVSYLYYDFPDEGGKTRVRSPGESLGVGLRYSTPQLSVTIGPGYEVRQTTRDFASGSERRDNESGVVVQGDVFYQATPLTNVSLIASYGAANDYVWVRAGGKRQISNFDNRDATTLHAGVEITGQGNKDGRSTQVGGLFEVAYPSAKASLQFRAGYSRLTNPDDSHESKPYFGVGFYRAF